LYFKTQRTKATHSLDVNIQLNYSINFYDSDFEIVSSPNCILKLNHPISFFQSNQYDDERDFCQMVMISGFPYLLIFHLKQTQELMYICSMHAFCVFCVTNAIHC
jgi:hypothetical protein